MLIHQAMAGETIQRINIGLAIMNAGQDTKGRKIISAIPDIVPNHIVLK